jgi:hypothetical protein
MQTIDPALATTAVALSAAMLMVQAGIAKKRLVWRTEKAKRERRRRPW